MTIADLKELAGLPTVDSIEIQPDGTVVVVTRTQSVQDYTTPPVPFLPLWPSNGEGIFPSVDWNLGKLTFRGNT